MKKSFLMLSFFLSFAFLNNSLYNNFSYYLESTPDSSKKIPGDKYDYNPTSQEIILHSKDEDLTLSVLGFNEEMLILKPKNIDNIQKIYFRLLSEKEIAEMLKPPMIDTTQQKDTVKSYTFSYNQVNGERIRTEHIDVYDGQIFFVVEESATFQGGDLNNFRDYIYKNTIYPGEALQKKMSGKTIVQFVIGHDGYIKDLKIIRSSGSEILDKEAIRVLKTSPQWKPGRQGGKVVNQLFTMPVSFVIQ